MGCLRRKAQGAKQAQEFEAEAVALVGNFFSVASVRRLGVCIAGVTVLIVVLVQTRSWYRWFAFHFLFAGYARTTFSTFAPSVNFGLVIRADRRDETAVRLVDVLTFRSPNSLIV
jgi:hypothetical protein